MLPEVPCSVYLYWLRKTMDPSRLFCTLVPQAAPCPTQFDGAPIVVSTNNTTSNNGNNSNNNNVNE